MMRKKMSDITLTLDDQNLASTFKLANEAISIKYSSPIIKSLSSEDNLILTQDQEDFQRLAT